MSSNNIKPILTRREIEVALGVAQGKTCPEIGDSLDLTNERIRSVMKKLRDKTGHRRKSQLAVWATSNKDWLTQTLKTSPLRKKPKRSKRKTVTS